MRVTTFAILLTLFKGALPAQEPPRLEVATVKPANPELRNTGGQRVENGLWLPGFTLVGLISQAYRDQLGANFSIEGGPMWIGKDRFDVNAVAAVPLSPAMHPAILRQLLADRFGLRVHTEAREQNVLALFPAREDGKLGPNVKPWSGVCKNNLPPRSPAGPPVARCSAFFRPPGLEVIGGSLAVVADLLSNPMAGLGRPVVDRTDIMGEFDMKLEFDFFAQDPNNPKRQALEAPLDPSLVTALREQWGLKLDSAKATVTVLVVDNASLPTEN